MRLKGRIGEPLGSAAPWVTGVKQLSLVRVGRDSPKAQLPELDSGTGLRRAISEAKATPVIVPYSGWQG